MNAPLHLWSPSLRSYVHLWDGVFTHTGETGTFQVCWEACGGAGVCYSSLCVCVLVTVTHQPSSVMFALSPCNVSLYAGRRQRKYI